MRLSSDWTRKLDRFNRAHPNHPTVSLQYDTRAVSGHRERWAHGVKFREKFYEPRWQVGVILPTQLPGFGKFLVYLEAGRWFLRLFTWSQKDQAGGDVGYADPDDRILMALANMDSTRYRHYEDHVVASDGRRQEAQEKHMRDVVHDSSSYYRGYDSPLVPVNPKVKSSAGWRHRIR